MEIIERNFFEVEVVFSSVQQAAQEQQARARQAPKDDNPHAEDKRIKGELGNVEAHRIGLLGEYGDSSIMGRPVDEAAYVAGDPRGDFAEFGRWIEVKTLQGYLLFNSMGDFASDIAVLAIHQPGRFDRVWVQGWIPKREFQEGHFVRDFGYGDRLCFKPRLLLPMVTLKAYCLIANRVNGILRSSWSR